MRQDVFVVAFQEAKSELLDITCKFEQLRQRKERLEGVISALGPMLGATAAPAALAEPKQAPASASPQSSVEPAYTFNQVAAISTEGDDAVADPFQRRVRDALKFSTPRREGLLNAI